MSSCVVRRVGPAEFIRSHKICAINTCIPGGRGTGCSSVGAVWEGGRGAGFLHGS